MAQELSYCGALVREHDPERFMLSMLMSPKQRKALWALFSFNHEIAKTREVVTETQLGLIRLQWWREEIAKIYEGQAIGKHEILEALAPVIKEYGLRREDFETLLYAREFDLEDVLPANVEGVLNYADFTSTPLMKMAVKVTGGDPDIEPVQPVAVNYALSGLLRAVDFYAAQRRCYLPADLLEAQKITPEKIYKMNPGDEVYEKLRDIVQVISEQVVEGVEPENRYLKASNIASLMEHRKIRKRGYDVFDPRIQNPPAFKALRLLAGVSLKG